MERTYSVCCGVDVGKSSHHFAAIIPATGELVFGGKVEQSGSGIRDALLSVSLFGSPVVVVDQRETWPPCCSPYARHGHR